MRFIILLFFAFCLTHAENIKKSNQKNCIELKEVKLSDNEIITPKVHEVLFSKHQNKCINKDMIKVIINDISNHFFSKGYITTKAYLKKQSIKDGILNIIILNGNVENIINNESKKYDSYLRTAFLGQKNELLNLRKLESSLEVINRVPSMNANFKILPGSKIGNSVILVDMKEEKPYSLTLGFSGDSDILDDDKDLTASFSYDNLFNINDIISYQYNSDLVQKKYQGTDGNEINYSFALGEYILDLTYADTSYKQGVDGADRTYLSNGDTKTYAAKILKNLFRDQNSKLDVSLGIKNKHTENYFENQLLDVSSYITTTFNVNLNHSIFKEWGQVYNTFRFESGKPWLGARTDSEHDAQEVLEFKKYVLSSNLRTNLFDLFRLSSNFSIQYTKDKLFSDNQLTLGSKYTVRGHKSTIYGNNGWYLNNTLSKDFNFNNTNKFINSLSLNLGLDYGEIRCENNTSSKCGNISGTSIGIQTNSKYFSSEISWNRPLKNIEGLENTDYFEYNMYFKF